MRAWKTVHDMPGVGFVEWACCLCGNRGLGFMPEYHAAQRCSGRARTTAGDAETTHIRGAPAGYVDGGGI